MNVCKGLKHGCIVLYLFLNDVFENNLVTYYFNWSDYVHENSVCDGMCV